MISDLVIDRLFPGPFLLFFQTHFVSVIQCLSLPAFVLQTVLYLCTRRGHDLAVMGLILGTRPSITSWHGIQYSPVPNESRPYISFGL